MWKRIALVMVIVWLVSAGTVSWFFIKGSTEMGTDNRRAVRLSPHEKDMVLGEMRAMLKAVSGVITALAEKDPKRAAEAASSGGMAMAVDATPGLMAKLPLDFKELGMGTHKAFDDLAAEIKGGATQEVVLKKVSVITSRCIACHETNRLTSDGTPTSASMITSDRLVNLARN